MKNGIALLLLTLFFSGCNSQHQRQTNFSSKNIKHKELGSLPVPKDYKIESRSQKTHNIPSDCKDIKEIINYGKKGEIENNIARKIDTIGNLMFPARYVYSDYTKKTVAINLDVDHDGKINKLVIKKPSCIAGLTDHSKLIVMMSAPFFSNGKPKSIRLIFNYYFGIKNSKTEVLVRAY